MRSDGLLGFPGGVVDDKLPNNNVDEAMKLVKMTVIREIKEEINFDVELNEPKYTATFVTSSDITKPYVLHTFLVKVKLTLRNILMDIDLELD